MFLGYGSVPSPVPGDAVRNNQAAVVEDRPAASADKPTEFHDVFNSTDDHPETARGAFRRNSLAGQYNGSEASAPVEYGEPVAMVTRQSSSYGSTGEANARQDAGRWGRGSGAWSDTIEPVIRDGDSFGRVRFSANRPDGSGPGAYVGAVPESADPTLVALAADYAAQARAASQFGAMR